MLAAWVLIAPVAAGQTVTRPQETSDGRAAQASDIVAVFRFANITREAADDWIGVGIAETVMADLDTRAVVSVISQEPIPSADGVSDDTAEPALAAGRRLGARWVVTGGYQRAGDQLRITGRLLETESGSVLSAAKVDGSFDQLFDLQDRIAAELTVGLLGPAGRAASIATRGGTPAATGRRPATGTTSTPGAAGDTATPALAAGAVAAVVPARVPPPGVIDGPPPPLPPEVISRDAQGRATIRAVRLSEGIRLDGNLDEEVYRTVPPITDYVQNVPDVGQPATERTETWVLFDGSNLYIAARCYDSAPSSEWVADEMRRDSRQLRQNDTFGLMLDTFYDRRNGLTFYTNPLGAIADFETTNEGNPNSDWNPVWDVRTGRFDGGWTVEMEIPFKSLKYPAGVAQVWGIQLRRVVRRKNEWNYITRVPLSAAGGQGSAGIFRVSAAATLTSLEVPAGSNTLEIKPYAIGGVTTDRMADPVVDNDRSGDFGLDVKYGVTQNLTADFTYNTDFAQVEVDEQQVNLTRFSLFFPEKREFFLEGRGIYDFGRSGGFGGGGGGGGFGRGLAPTLFFSRQIGLQRGQVVPILGGGRLTGKAGAFSIGALNMQTDDETVSGARSTNFTVLRVKRDLLRRSSVGMIYTGRSVSLVGDGASHAYGMDANFAFFENVNFNGYFAKTHTPDSTGKDTSYQARFNYAADRWGVEMDHLLVEDNFVPEVGFVRRDDFRRTFVSGRFSPRPAAIESVRRFVFQTSLDYTLTADTNVLETRQNQLRVATEFENSDQLRVDLTRSYELLEDLFEIADGVAIPVGGYTFSDVSLSYQLGAQRRTSGSFSVQRGAFFSGDITAVGFTRGRLVLTPQLSVEPGISINWVDLPEGSFTTNLVTTRVNYTFTPRMFFSGLLQYNSSNDTLTSNLRLRWEYQPGSELFVVYTEDRDTATLDPRRFSQTRNHGFVVKFNKLFRY
jgi:TolB-like protein